MEFKNCPKQAGSQDVNFSLVLYFFSLDIYNLDITLDEAGVIGC